VAVGATLGATLVVARFAHRAPPTGLVKRVIAGPTEFVGTPGRGRLRGRRQSSVFNP